MKVLLSSFYKALTPKYLADRKSEISSIEEIVLAENFTEIEIKFHKIAGSAGGFGLNSLSEMASKIEKASEHEDIKMVSTHFETYKKALFLIELSFLD